MDGPDTGFLVYFIVGGHFVKVGYSCSARKRLKELQTGNPHELILAHTIGYPDEASARVGEIKWRARLAECGKPACGEWIELEPILIDVFARVRPIRLVHVTELCARPPATQAELIEGALARYGLRAQFTKQESHEAA